MGGGLMQLVAYGAQDIYLTGNPQITFFRVVYRRHTNFSMENIEQTFNGTAAFGRKFTATVSRNGDLVHKMFLNVELPELKPFERLRQARDEHGTPMHEERATDGEGEEIQDEEGRPVYDEDSPPVMETETTHFQYVDRVGHALIQSVELEIGGQRIDKHYGDWLEIFNELSVNKGHKDGYSAMINGTDVGDEALYNVVDSDPNTSSKKRTVIVPLQFFFNRCAGLALPLIALQYHEVKLNFTFTHLNDLVKSKPSYAKVQTQEALKTSLSVDYIYLDTDERRRFAQTSHELLIEQVQFNGDESSSKNIVLNHNHPVKEIIWVEKELSTEFGKYQSTYTKASFTLNGHERFSKRSPMYFQLMQPYNHHTNVPPIGKGINVYSFALKPEETNPSGSLNMSRIDSSILKLEGINESINNVVKIFVVNYNILRLTSGMGGVAFSN